MLDIGEEKSEELKVVFLNIMGGDAVEAVLELDLALLAVASPRLRTNCRYAPTFTPAFAPAFAQSSFNLTC